MKFTPKQVHAALYGAAAVLTAAVAALHAQGVHVPVLLDVAAGVALLLAPGVRKAPAAPDA